MPVENRSAQRGDMFGMVRLVFVINTDGWNTERPGYQSGEISRSRNTWSASRRAYERLGQKHNFYGINFVV